MLDAAGVQHAYAEWRYAAGILCVVAICILAMIWRGDDYGSGRDNW